MRFLRACFLLPFFTLAATSARADAPIPDAPIRCTAIHETLNGLLPEAQRQFGRTVCADVVAMDQMLVYNRFGSFNPFGMIYALRRDVVGVDRPVTHLSADDCDTLDGTEGFGKGLAPGAVRLKDCKRPRPLTLRANVGDVLHVRLTNLLRPLEEGAARPDAAPDLSRDFCDAKAPPPNRGNLFHLLRDWVSWGDPGQKDHGEVTCGLPGHVDAAEPGATERAPDWPYSRGANMAIQGLTAFVIADGRIAEAPDACKGLGAIGPGASVDCFYMVEREGPFFMASTGAPAGGEGDGGSITHGLFGAVVAERADSRWYRSQLTRAGFDAAFPPQVGGTVRHARAPEAFEDMKPYEATRAAGADDLSPGKVPVLDMLREVAPGAQELVHADLNAIIYRKDAPDESFREFSVFFHDELKSFYARNFEELGAFGGGQLAGVRDGFAINYGASGMGDMLLANRKGIGPAANCAECLYEEFFLTSWANGDPALLEQFSDDPSNVHHSYLNDRVVFRNFHAGPKETHVFHLHAHQWFAGNDGGRGSYLDSQTVGPQQGFSYDIYQGGMEVYHKGEGDLPGWFETLGSGNRNRTVGDSIFHCHLYPHFAQGMWELWRVHDVLEDGTRKLPDGQWEPVLSLAEMSAAVRALKRPGSVADTTGAWIEPGAALVEKVRDAGGNRVERLMRRQLGTPVPALVPLPGQAWPVLPSYPETVASLDETGGISGGPAAPAPSDTPVALETFPGYPFYVAGKPGHRPPQAPMDIARELTAAGQVTNDYLDGGLPRHVMLDDSARKLPFDLPATVADALAADPAPTTLAQAQGDAGLRAREVLQSQVIAAALALGDLTMKLESATIELKPYDGTALERSAMGFHHRGEADGVALSLHRADGTQSEYDPAEGGYTSVGGSIFAVNSSAPKPGAPFADPCGAPAGLASLWRVGASEYLWKDGTGEQPVFLDAGLSQPAGDAEVSNWVHYERDAGGKPDFYVTDGAGGSVVIDRDALIREADPFVTAAPGASVQQGFGDTRFASDPAVVGYRRYEASAVQVDMVTNRAGWHDPQARINVLSEVSDGYKTGSGRISPKITASEEPFFFRALSGECIEFRHTNELPKDLELDDFQVRTPTDTIGQHIHLVKFDVTSSDGSGNGFNYEDGTLAPDEIAARICAAKNAPASAGDVVEARDPAALKIREFPGLCKLDDGHWHVAEAFDHSVWKRTLGENRALFQTTTQRWFADPVLSELRAGDPAQGRADRTLRTVFSHDHFGPSSIQQHGFYTALVIEPQTAMICSETNTDCTAPRDDRALVEASAADVGARKVIVDLFPLKATEPGVNTAEALREFAVSIADFATLYDPRAGVTPAAFERTMAGPGEKKGMATLLCEARHAGDPQALRDICGSDVDDHGTSIWWAHPEDVPPAWLAEGRPGDLTGHQTGLEPQLFSAGITVPHEGADLTPAAFLEDYLKTYRARAAGFADATVAGARLARPVSPPPRPESISVDHHDPYLVNYRGEPFPIRVGTNSSQSADCALQPLAFWVAQLGSGVSVDCEISRQKTDTAGDMANVLVSGMHGDPVVPILNSFDGDTLQFRLIQGAQEVQHTFNVEGYTWPRNIDQRFPSMMRELEDITPPTTLVRACYEGAGVQSALRIARAGRPEEYDRWAEKGSKDFPVGSDAHKFWSDFDAQIADCFNMDGRIAAQEIGISEHFEFKSAFLYDSNIAGVQKIMMRNLRAAPPLTRDRALAELEALLGQLQAHDVLAPRDTPYHFGTQDAQWNGAWGLVRVRQPAERLARLNALIAEVEALIADLRAGRGLTPRGMLGPETAQRLSDLTLPEIDDLLDRPMPGLAVTTPVALPAPVGSAPTLPLPAGTGTPLPRDEIQQSAALLPLAAYTGSQPVGMQALRLLDRLRPGVDLPGILRPRPSETPEDYTRVADCDERAPRVYAAVAAIESETVFPGGILGTPYSDELRDHDGLFLALLDPRGLIRPDAPGAVTEEDLNEPASWVGIPRSRIIKAIQASYDRPEPLVLNVKAGDCVNVTLLNALSFEGKAADPARQDMRDRPGDAEMPGITSINVDPNWSGNTTTKPGHNIPVDVRQIRDGSEVRPSARLAVTLPLPVVTPQSAIGRPFGQNPVLALDGVRGADADPLLEIRNPVAPDQMAQIEQFEFYAGLAWGRRPGAAVAPDLVLSALPPAVLNLPVTVGAAQTLGDVVEAVRTERVGIAQDLAARVERISAEPVTPAPGTIIRPLERPGLTLPTGSALRPQPRPTTPGAALRERIALPEMVRRADQLRQVAPVLDGLEVTLGAEPALRSRIEAVLGAGGITSERLSAELGALAPRREALQRQEERLATAVKALSTLSVDYKPYAFGALPIKSFGDLIGHPTHGLIGAVTVAPQSASLSEERVRRLGFDDPACNRLLIGRDNLPVLRERTLERLLGLPRGGITPQLPQLGLAARPPLCRSFVMVPRSRDDGARKPVSIGATTLSVSDPFGARHRIRQVTLFWQDGLNHRDARSANSWKPPLRFTGRLTLDELQVLVRERPELAGLPLAQVVPRDGPALPEALLRGNPTLGDAVGRIATLPGRQMEFTLPPEVLERLDLGDLVAVPVGDRSAEKIVADCKICDDSYDFGEKGVSFRAEPFDVRLRGWQGNPTGIERHYDFNAYEYGAVTDPGDTSASFFRLAANELPAWPKAPLPVVRAVAGEELVVHVVHPGGRARQRAFVAIAQDYDDLFPGFGFPRGALLAPGKATTASITKPLEAGCYLFFDGPTQIRAGGVWGLIDVVSQADLNGRALEDSAASRCQRGGR